MTQKAASSNESPDLAGVERVAFIDLRDASETERLGVDLSLVLKPGDVVALIGDLGAGKSTLARAIIRSLASEGDLEVPSPTFTIVQSYEGRIPVSHLDLYRLSSEDELAEIGFDDLLVDGTALVEWPHKADGVMSRADIVIEIQHDAERGRRAAIAAKPSAFARIERTLSVRDFLDRAGHGLARRSHLNGDASSRRYETIDASPSNLVLMDAPAQPDGPPIRDGLPYSQLVHLAEDVRPFVALSRALSAAGFTTPRILETDLDRGLLLIGNLGQETILNEDGTPDLARYRTAMECIARLHALPWSDAMPIEQDEEHRLSRFDRRALTIETELLIDWYVPFSLGRKASSDERDLFFEAWTQAFEEIAGSETSLVLRDFHSPNIIWQPDAIGCARIGLLDFQDAMIGPSAYDVASLAQDARVTIPAELEASLVSTYVAERRRSDPDFKPFLFERDYAVMAAQRASKVLGIFVRLAERDGKLQYKRHIPRIRDYLARTLDHPTLSAVKSLYGDWGILPFHR